MTESGMRMPVDAWYLYHRDGVIPRILERGTVFVARDSQQPIWMHGFLVAERIDDALCVHWAYIKRDSRGYGVARDLLDTAVEVLGAGAERLVYSHDVRVLVEGYDSTGRRKLLPSMGIERKLQAMGFQRVAVEKLVREVREVA